RFSCFPIKKSSPESSRKSWVLLITFVHEHWLWPIFKIINDDDMTLKFKLRRPQEKQTSLYVEFKKNGQKITLFPGKVVQTEHWHKDKQDCKKNHPLASEINLYIKIWKENSEKIVLNLETQNQFISKERIQEKLDEIYIPESPTEKIQDFIEF